MLIDVIDEAGYCRVDLDEMSARLGCPRDVIEDVLKVVQGFEPSGVGARDLAECLAIQLREKDRLDPCMQLFLANLELVAKRDFAQLSADLRLSTPKIMRRHDRGNPSELDAQAGPRLRHASPPSNPWSRTCS